MVRSRRRRHGRHTGGRPGNRSPADGRTQLSRRRHARASGWHGSRPWRRPALGGAALAVLLAVAALVSGEPTARRPAGTGPQASGPTFSAPAADRTAARPAVGLAAAAAAGLTAPAADPARGEAGRTGKRARPTRPGESTRSRPSPPVKPVDPGPGRGRQDR